MRSDFRITYSEVSPVDMEFGRIVSLKESHSVCFREGSIQVAYEIRFQEGNCLGTVFCSGFIHVYRNATNKMSGMHYTYTPHSHACNSYLYTHNYL